MKRVYILAALQAPQPVQELVSVFLWLLALGQREKAVSIGCPREDLSGCPALQSCTREISRALYSSALIEGQWRGAARAE